METSGQEGAVDGFEDDDSDYVEISGYQRPNGYLWWDSLASLNSSTEYRTLVSYGMASTEQKLGVFPKRVPKNEILPSNFTNGPCYELWVNGQLVGLADVATSGFISRNELVLFAKLESVYIRTRSRKKGLLRPFMEAAGVTVAQELATYIMRESAAGRALFQVTVDADLYSPGGQAAVRILGQQIEQDMLFLGHCAGTDVQFELIDDAW